MTAVLTRIERLEGKVGGRDGCPRCGWGGDGPRAYQFTVRRWNDPPEEPCSLCGRAPPVFTLRLGETSLGELLERDA
jgi:hypothetical protein